MPGQFFDRILDLTTGQMTIRELEVPDGTDPRGAFQKALDDCPQCQAARAAGEVPVIHDGIPHALQRHRIFRKRPRWRTRKRP